jgi:outer membrane receptor for ferrienterochelin and colicins
MRKVFVLLLLSCLSLGCFAQNNVDDKASIEGHVLDKTNEEPIPYANVIIKGTTNGALSDKDGDFIFRNLKEGKYILVISVIGYEKQEYVIDVTKNQTHHAHIEMKPTQVNLDEVVVSASKVETNRKDASVIVNVIGNKNFEKTSSENILQSLPYQSGVRVEYSCQNCGVPQVRINGLEGSYTQLLVNSRPVMSSLVSLYGLEQIPTNMVDRVEVIKGGGSCLYGSNAIAGVVNIITKEPLYNMFSIGESSEVIKDKFFSQYYNANAAILSKDGKAGASFYQSFRKRNPYDDNGDGFSEIGKLDAFSFGTNTYYKISNKQKLSFEYHTVNEQRRGGNAFDKPPHQADLCEMTNYKIHSLGGNYDYVSLNGKNHYNIYSSLQYVDRDSYFGSHQEDSAYGKTKDLTLVSGFQGSNQLDKFLFFPSTIVYGMEYNRDELNDKYVSYNRHLDQTTYIFGGFFQSEWKIKDFNVLLGARLDKHNLIDDAIFSPRVNIMYKPNENLQMRLSYSTGYKAPQTYNEDLHAAQVGGESLIIRLIPNLKPEYSNSISFSTDFYTRITEDLQANILLEGFYTNLKDAFAYRETTQDSVTIEEKYNAKGAKIYGVSLTSKISYLAKYTFTLGYTLQESKYKEIQYWSDENIEGTKTMLRTPNDYGFLTFSIEPNKEFSLSVTGTYTGKMKIPHLTTNTLTTSQRFFDCNIVSSYDFTLTNNVILQLSGGVKNIFNSYQDDFDSGVDRDSEYIYGPIQPRTIFLALKLFTK